MAPWDLRIKKRLVSKSLEGCTFNLQRLFRIMNVLSLSKLILFYKQLQLWITVLQVHLKDPKINIMGMKPIR